MSILTNAINANTTTPLTVKQGGTNNNFSGLASGAVIYSSSATQLANLPYPGTAGLTLLSGSGTPAWSNLPPITEIKVTVFTSSGSYTRTAGMQFAEIEVVGGGGSGGGVAITTGGVATSSGGSGGGYAKKLFTLAQVGTTANTVTVGAGGAAPTAGNNIGNVGTSTSVALNGTGTLTITGNNGTGGNGGASGAVANANAINGGASSGGDININGGPSTTAMALSALQVFTTSSGGDSFYGKGYAGALNANGTAATSYGVGGPGCTGNNQGTAFAGGAGSSGIVIITEYISS